MDGSRRLAWLEDYAASLTAAADRPVPADLRQGIRFDHVEFGGRAVTGIDEVTAGGNAADCNGHGTHVSGTVGGATYGVAKGVRLVAVRVLDCSGSGTTSGVVAGIEPDEQVRVAGRVPETPHQPEHRPQVGGRQLAGAAGSV